MSVGGHIKIIDLVLHWHKPLWMGEEWSSLPKNSRRRRRKSAQLWCNSCLYYAYKNTLYTKHCCSTRYIHRFSICARIRSYSFAERVFFTWMYNDMVYQCGWYFIMYTKNDATQARRQRKKKTIKVEKYKMGKREL